MSPASTRSGPMNTAAFTLGRPIAFCASAGSRRSASSTTRPDSSRSLAAGRPTSVASALRSSSAVEPPRVPTLTSVARIIGPGGPVSSAVSHARSGAPGAATAIVRPRRSSMERIGGSAFFAATSATGGAAVSPKTSRGSSGCSRDANRSAESTVVPARSTSLRASASAAAVSERTDRRRTSRPSRVKSPIAAATRIGRYSGDVAGSGTATVRT